MNHVNQSKSWLALIGVAIASFLGCLDFTIVNTALPAIKANLHASVGELQWVVNIFILSLSSFMAIMGKMADIYGRRKVLYIGIIIFGLASLMAGCAINIYWLNFWRLIQGVASTILYTASGAIVSNIFPIEKRGKAMGIFFGISFTGLAAGPALGGLIVSVLSWRWVFLVNVPVVVLSLLICSISVTESKNSQLGTKVDYLGALIMLIGLASFTIVLTEGNDWGWVSFKTILTLVFAVIMLILLYIVENKSSSPIIKFDLFTNIPFVSGIIATFFLAFFYCLDFFLMPLYLHLSRGELDYTIGLMLLCTTIMVALISPIVGKTVDRKGPKKPLLVGFGFFIISATIQANFTAYTSIYIVILAFILMGIAWGSIVGPSTILSLSALPKNSEALAIGTCWTLHNIGGTIGLGLGISIYHYELEKHNNSFITGFHGAMTLLIISSALAFILLMINFRLQQKGRLE